MIASKPEPAADVAWAMTTGEAGMRSQARGLAEASGLAVVEKTVGIGKPWRWLPGHLVPSPLTKLSRESDVVAPPWPRLLVTCGRRSTPISIGIRHASRGATLTVHVQNPLCRLDAFDLVVAMRHDGVTGPNVLNIDTALHAISQAKLAAARIEWASRFSSLPRPLLGVVLGGKTRDYAMTPAKVTALIERIDRLRQATGGGIVMTPSRRTEAHVKAAFQARYGADPNAFIWDETGDNPYVAILALADRLVVTSDSVSMVSEALAAGCPVETFAPEGRARRHEMFIDNLIARGLVRPFEGAVETSGPRPPIDTTEVVAARVREMLAARSG